MTQVEQLENALRSKNPAEAVRTLVLKMSSYGQTNASESPVNRLNVYLALLSPCQNPNGFPCGSSAMANQPIPGTGDLGTVIVAPSDSAFSSDASICSTSV